MIPSYDVAYTPSPVYAFPGEYWSYRRMISADDCPHLHTKEKLRERENIVKKWGKNSTFVKSMIKGEFQAEEEGNPIFEESHIELMKRAMHGFTTPVRGDIRAAGDVSGGGDNYPLFIRDGTDVMEVPLPTGITSEIEVAEAWVKSLKALDVQPWQFCIDGGGIGATVGNYMELRLDFSGINRFQANVGPKSQGQRWAYYDFYTEIHWWIREMLSYEILRVQFNQKILEQMRRRLYVEMPGEKIKTEPKGGATGYRAKWRSSPDELDSLIYLFSDLNMDAITRGVVEKRKPARAAAITDAPTKMEREAMRAVIGTGAFSGMKVLPKFKAKEWKR
jgi:hypothetical protein